MLYDSPTHSVTSYSLSTARESGGAGTAYTYTSAQSAVPCIVNTASASTQELFAQQGIRVTHTVSFLASALTTTLTRGMKLVADDTGVSLHVEGIRQGRAYGNIPALVYADCSQLA